MSEISKIAADRFRSLKIDQSSSQVKTKPPQRQEVCPKSNNTAFYEEIQSFQLTHTH